MFDLDVNYQLSGHSLICIEIQVHMATRMFIFNQLILDLGSKKQSVSVNLTFKKNPRYSFGDVKRVIPILLSWITPLTPKL